MQTTPHSLLHRLRHSPASERSADWERFVELFTPLLYGWARGFTEDGVEAADVVQEVFVALVRVLPQFEVDKNKSFRGWLRTLLVNRWRDLRRRRQPDAPMDHHRLETLVKHDETDPLAEAEYRREIVQRVLQLMQRDFEPTTWQACWQTKALGRPASQVAVELGISVAAVHAATYRVLRRLRQELEGFVEL